MKPRTQIRALVLVAVVAVGGILLGSRPGVSEDRAAQSPAVSLDPVGDWQAITSRLRSTGGQR